MNVITGFFENYGNFAGRARRREYFTFLLVNDVMFLLLLFADSMLGLASKDFTIGWLSGLWTLFTFIPQIAVNARRMHDIGRSGWWQLVSLIPVIGIVFVGWVCRGSSPGDNAWGPNPKAVPVLSYAT